MRFGSVSFFKKCIRAALFIVLPVCLVLLVSLSVCYVHSARNLQREIDKLNRQIAALQASGITLRETDATGKNSLEDNAHATPVPEQPGVTVKMEEKKTAAPLLIDRQAELRLPAESQNGQLPAHPSVSSPAPVPGLPGQPASEESGPGPEPSAKPQQLLTAYGHILPHFQQAAPLVKPGHGRVVYLTFDDGPSARTREILDILDHYDVKATFFVINQPNKNLAAIISQAAATGHAIGMHSATHDLKTIYASVEAFLVDMEANHQYIYEHTGVYPQIFRFPGGSVNSYNRQTGADIRAEMTARGFVHFDWNCSAEDAIRPLPKAAQIVDNVLATSRNRDRLIILMHDTHSKNETVKALPQIIEALKDRGYRFATLSAESEPIVFRP